jgi:hypothetical protein
LISGIFLKNACEEDTFLTGPADFLYGPNSPLLFRELHDSDLSTEYEYNADSWPVAKKSKYFYNRYSYNNRNQLIKLEFFLDPMMFSSYMPPDWQERTEWVTPENTSCGRYFSYDYDAEGRLSRINTYAKWDGPFELVDYTTIEYDPDEQIKQRKWYDADGTPQGFVTYQYDPKGNAIEEAKYYMTDPDQPHARILYEFDNRKNPYTIFRQTGQPGRYTNPNNIVKETHIIYDLSNPGIIEQQSELTYTYQYDLQGFPVKRNETVLIYR